MALGIPYELFKIVFIERFGQLKVKNASIEVLTQLEIGWFIG